MYGPHFSLCTQTWHPFELSTFYRRGEHSIRFPLADYGVLDGAAQRAGTEVYREAGAEQHLDKGVFIKELEVALAEGRIDLAVHSLKDVPSELDAEFELAAVLPRARTEDVLIVKLPN